MGRDLGTAALMRRQARPFGVLLGGALLVAAFAGIGAGPAWGDPTPQPAPTPVVSPPSQQQIDDAKAALDRVRHPGRTAPKQLTQVAGPTDPAGRDGVTSRISDQAWWTIGAGVLVLMVASETTRVSVRRAKHRKRV
ncbi:hypothetical protein ACVW00_002971 [Marmoricola sp. URHA0025 HA25]